MIIPSFVAISLSGIPDEYAGTFPCGETDCYVPGLWHMSFNIGDLKFGLPLCQSHYEYVNAIIGGPE